MAEIEFNYNNSKIIIQCKEEDVLSIIIDQFLLKAQINKDNVYFLYKGQELNQSNKFNEVADIDDKNRKKIEIIVKNKEVKNKQDNKPSLIKPKYTICPKCNDSINFKINSDFTISLNDCKMGHNFDNMSIKDFEKSQFIDQSKIICQQCKLVDKAKSFENQFFICCDCNMKLCPLCKESHDESHYIIDYEEKNYMCYIHKDIYNSYCKKCKKDLCTLCQNEHRGHSLIIYENILPNEDKFTEELKNTKKFLEEYKIKIEGIISELININEKLGKYYNLCENIIKNYEMRGLENYSLIQNINNIIEFNNLHIKDLNKQIKTSINDIIDLFLYKKDDEDTLIYDDGNIIINVVKENLITQFKDKEICFMTTEFTEGNIEKKSETLIKESKKLYSDINKYYYLFRSLVKREKAYYIDGFVDFLNENGDKASAEVDNDENDNDTRYYCLITSKTIKQLCELNQIYCKSKIK